MERGCSEDSRCPLLWRRSQEQTDKMKKKESDGLEPTGLTEELKGYAVKRL